ncbi:cyclooctat-9-en-7-ol 5-monooxygenase-like [Sycon ciliatum]|uniref:cyclooctat-9-en-7-ol 5-monooxygenase-like n=1 Tax=Sycon ciliatum TaxID=27933 RepID=UPI0031F61CFD
MAMPLEVPVAKAVLYALLPILIACYFLLRKGKTYVNLPPMVEKGYSNWTGHIRFIIADYHGYDQPWLANMKKLADSCSHGVMAVYSLGPKWLARPMYIVKDPGLISALLTSGKANRFSNLQEVQVATSGRMSMGALVGKELKRHRKILTLSILAKRPMARFVEIMTSGVCEYLDTLPTPARDCPLDLDLADPKVIGILVGEAFANFSFGVDISSHSKDPANVKLCRELESAVRFLFKVIGERLTVAGPLKLLSDLNFITNFKLWRTSRFLRNEFILPAMRKRKEELASGAQVPDDAMTMMLESGDADNEPFSEEEICDEGVFMLSSGFEATAFSLLWAMYHLGRYPEQQEICYKEIQDVMSKRPPGSLPTISDIEELSHMSCIIQESMRMKNITDGAARDVNVDVELGPYTIPAGSSLLALGKCNAMSEESFENADQFKPERWKNDPTGGAKRPGAVNIPFGLGQYKCFGQPLALVAMKSLLAVWIQRYRIELLSEDIKPTYRATFSPTVLQVRMHPRGTL